MPVNEVLVGLPKLAGPVQDSRDILLPVTDRQCRVALHQVGSAAGLPLDIVGHAFGRVDPFCGDANAAVAPLQFLIQCSPEDPLDVESLLHKGGVPPKLEALLVGLAMLAPKEFRVGVKHLE